MKAFLWILGLSIGAACQSSKKDSEQKETIVQAIDCEQELVLECGEGKIDRCVLTGMGVHECVEKPESIVFNCNEAIGFHCPDNEVDRCTFDPKGNHECVPDPRLAKDFPKSCKKSKTLKCPTGQIDACELDAHADHECVPHIKEYLVKFKSEQGLRLSAQDLPKRLPGAKTIGQYLKSRLLHITFDNIDVVTMAIELSKIFGRDDIDYVVENLTVKAFSAPNDARFSEQWAHEKIGSTTAWGQNTGDKHVVVAVIDTGVDYKHVDLADNMYKNTLENPTNGVDDDNNGFVDDYHGWDFYDNDNDPMDETSSSNKGHGTHCAGIVGAVGNNSIGVVGATQKVTIMPVRFLGPRGEGSLIGAVRAIDYAVDNGAQVINASFGVSAGASQVQPLLEAIARAEEKGVVFVAAASNDGKNNDQFDVYPANAPYPNVISVAASDRTDGRPSWSNYGKKVSLAAPGNDIISTLPGNKYGNLSGTSMAAPLVAGTVALLLSQNRSLAQSNVAATDFAREITSKPENIRSLLQASGHPVNIETACNCRLDIAGAFAGLNGSGLFISPSSAHMSVGDNLQLRVFGGDGQYTLTSSSPDIVRVTNQGLLEARGIGEAKVTVVDGANRRVESFSYRVSQKNQKGGGSCPLAWPRVCSIVCFFVHDLAWCG